MIRHSRTVTATVAGAFLVAATAFTTASPALAEPRARADQRDGAHQGLGVHQRVGAHRRTAAEVALPIGFRPEGITSGPGDTYYVGSLADGAIRTGDLSRGTGRTLLPGVTGRALRGLAYDQRSKSLWAVGQDGTTGIVLVVDARTGAVRQRIEIPGSVFLNDVVLTAGRAWVTDSRVDRLTSIDRTTPGAPRFLPLTGAWPVDQAGNHANGIRALPGGELILDHSTAGGLWAADPATGVVTGIPVTGGQITGGDGLELDHDTLYVVRGNGQAQVSVVDLDRRRGRWTAEVEGELTSSRLDVPSTATLVKRTLWAVNARFGVADPAAAAYWITPLDTRSATRH